MPVGKQTWVPDTQGELGGEAIDTSACTVSTCRETGQSLPLRQGF
jgi:hypothetical protein